MDELSTVLMALALGVMVSASLSDVRSREVSDIHWPAICCLGAVGTLVTEDLPTASWFLCSDLLLVLFMFWERVSGIWSAIVLAASVALSAIPVIPYGHWSGLVTSVTSVAVAGLYYSGAIRGGADAKALISLSILCPTYSGFPCLIWSPHYPEALVFCPVLSMLVLALILSAAFLIPVVVRNIGSGVLGISSYRCGIDEARSGFVWPVEDVVGGKVVRVGIPREKEKVLVCLEDYGRSDVAVTPMIPFILPITVAFATVFVLGPPLPII